MNNTAVNIHVQVIFFVCGHLFSFLWGEYLRVELLSCVSVGLTLEDITRLVFQSGYIYTFTLPLISHLCQCLGIIFLFYCLIILYCLFSCFIGHTVHLIVILCSYLIMLSIFSCAYWPFVYFHL